MSEPETLQRAIFFFDKSEKNTFLYKYFNSGNMSLVSIFPNTCVWVVFDLKCCLMSFKVLFKQLHMSSYQSICLPFSNTKRPMLNKWVFRITYNEQTKKEVEEEEKKTATRPFLEYVLPQKCKWSPLLWLSNGKEITWNWAITDLFLRYDSVCCIFGGLVGMALGGLGSVQAGQRQQIYDIKKGVARE